MTEPTREGAPSRQSGPADAGGPPRQAGRAFRRGEALVGIVLALLTFELLSRQLYCYPKAYDPDFGVVPLAGKSIRLRIEGNGVSHWEPRGLRLRPWGSKGGEIRILAVGDSFTEAVQVDDDEVFTAVLEAELQKRGMKAAILNVGQSSLLLADYVERAAVYLRTFLPDWTVVQVREDDFTTDAWSPSKTHFATASGRGDEFLVVPPLEGARRRRSGLSQRS